MSTYLAIGIVPVSTISGITIEHNIYIIWLAPSPRLIAREVARGIEEQVLAWVLV